MRFMPTSAEESAVPRNELTTAHFQSWIDWCKGRGLGLDFNPSFFSHPLANDGFTLSSSDPKVRSFWIEHGMTCRRIAADMGKASWHTRGNQLLDS